MTWESFQPKDPTSNLTSSLIPDQESNWTSELSDVLLLFRFSLAHLGFLGFFLRTVDCNHLGSQDFCHWIIFCWCNLNSPFTGGHIMVMREWRLRFSCPYPPTSVHCSTRRPGYWKYFWYWVLLGTGSILMLQNQLFTVQWRNADILLHIKYFQKKLQNHQCNIDIRLWSRSSSKAELEQHRRDFLSTLSQSLEVSHHFTILPPWYNTSHIKPKGFLMVVGHSRLKTIFFSI